MSDTNTAVASPKTRTVNSDSFLSALGSYADVKAIVDDYVKSEHQSEYFADLVARAQAAIAGLQSLVTDGKSFTPPEALGFGSDNASQIASAIIGSRLSNGKLRTNAAKIGREWNKRNG